MWKTLFNGPGKGQDEAPVKAAIGVVESEILALRQRVDALESGHRNLLLEWGNAHAKIAQALGRMYRNGAIVEREKEREAEPVDHDPDGLMQREAIRRAGRSMMRGS